MLLQRLCRQRLGWDEVIPEESIKLWKTWSEELTGLSDLEINCFKPLGGDVATKIQIDYFADASQNAYGMVSFVRMKCKSGRSCCRFLMGKARLTPL